MKMLWVPEGGGAFPQNPHVRDGMCAQDAYALSFLNPITLTLDVYITEK